MSDLKEDIMKKNFKVLLMLVFVAFALSCASTNEMNKQASSKDASINKQDTQAKLDEKEEEELYQPRRLPSFDW